MKKIIYILITLLTPIVMYAEVLTVSAKLANDKLITPDYGYDKITSVIMVKAKFNSIKEVLSVKHGESKDIWYYVMYDVVSVEKGEYARNQITFIVKDWWPTNKYRKVKTQIVPFREGTEFVFYMNKVERTSHIYDDGVPELWEIVRWE